MEKVLRQADIIQQCINRWHVVIQSQYWEGPCKQTGLSRYIFSGMESRNARTHCEDRQVLNVIREKGWEMLGLGFRTLASYRGSTEFESYWN